MRVFPFAVGLACLSTALYAQGNAASLAGQALDPKGAVVAGAAITVRNTDNSSVRTLTAGHDGTFRIAGLAPGAYTVEARAGSLGTRHPVRLTVTLGSSTEVRLQLDIAPVTQTATVSARTGTVEGNTVAPPEHTAEASEGTFLPGLTVTYLPNRDRNFAQFTNQVAATVDAPDGTGVSIAGQRSSATAVELDGTRFTDPLLGTRRGAQEGGLLLPLSAVREFQVLESGVDASVGETGAGLISVATKSGANRPRGDAFYTGRPSQFTSPDAFGHSLNSTQNAFGFGYGLPLQKNRSFAFLSVEQDFVQSPFYTQFAPQLSTAAVTASLSGLQGQVPTRQAPTTVFLRLDQTLSAHETLNAEAGYTRVQSSNVQAGTSEFTRSLNAQSLAGSFGGQSLTSRLGLASVLNDHTVNSAVVAWSSDHRARTPNSFAPEQFVNGFGALGGDADGQHLYTSHQLQLIDDLTLTRGKTGLTVGARFAADPAHEQQEQNLNGRFDYSSLTDLLNNTPRRFQQTFATGNTRYTGTVDELALYTNLHAELRRDLFLTAGVRWAGQWNPQPAQPNPAFSTTRRISSDLSEWQPRLGLSWTPGTRTVIRASAGLFAAPSPATLFHRAASDNGTVSLTADSYFDPQLLLLTGANTASPHALSGAPTGLSTPHAVLAGIDPAFRNPRSLNSAISVEQHLSPKLQVTTGFLHGSSWRLERQLDANLASPIAFTSAGTPVFPSARPIAGVGRLLVTQSTAHSSYNAGYVSINAPISRRTSLLANYTLSRTRDDSSGDGPYSPVSAVNPYRLRQEAAYSALDQRHILNVNAIVNLPAGFKLDPFFQTHSGAPYTPIVGLDTENDSNDWNARAILNGVMAPRNIDRQPLFADLDLRLVKDFTLKGEGHHLDLFMDIFNLPGAGNRRFAVDGLSLYGSIAHPVASAGMPLFAPGVTQLGGPREIQFTVRLVGF